MASYTSFNRVYVIQILIYISASQVYSAGWHDVPLPKVAVIGGGVGGATVAYKLHKVFGSALPQIDVYEKDDVGGRLKVVPVGGKVYEVGGTIIHPNNQHMNEFCEIFGLTKMSTDDSFALFDMQTKVLQVSRSWWSSVQLLWRYSWSLISLRQSSNQLLADFDRIYKWQSEYQAFTTVPNLLMSMSDDLIKSSHVSLRQLLLTKGVSDRLISELVTVATKVNYGQTVDNMNGLSGSVSVAGMTPGLFSIKGGNYQVPKRLLEASNASLLHHKISRVVNITSEQGKPKYRLERSDGGAQDYDIVVVASPFIEDVEGVEFAGFDTDMRQYKRAYHQIYTYLVKGTANYNWFGYTTAEEMPDAVFPIHPDDFYNVLERVRSVEGEDDSVWKVFAGSELSDAQLDTLFMSRQVTELVRWHAYPEYSSDMEYAPFVLAPKLYYVNTIELAASAMEMSAVGATNVVNLIIHEWLGNEHLIDNMFVIEEKHIKMEL